MSKRILVIESCSSCCHCKEEKTTICTKTGKILTWSGTGKRDIPSFCPLKVYSDIPQICSSCGNSLGKCRCWDNEPGY